jgi:hypothetical protein
MPEDSKSKPKVSAKFSYHIFIWVAKKLFSKN